MPCEGTVRSMYSARCRCAWDIFADRHGDGHQKPHSSHRRRKALNVLSSVRMQVFEPEMSNSDGDVAGWPRRRPLEQVKTRLELDDRRDVASQEDEGVTPFMTRKLPSSLMLEKTLIRCRARKHSRDSTPTRRQLQPSTHPGFGITWQQGRQCESWSIYIRHAIGHYTPPGDRFPRTRVSRLTRHLTSYLSTVSMFVSPLS